MTADLIKRPIIVGRVWRNGRLIKVVTEGGQRVTVYPGSNVVAFPKSIEGARTEHGGDAA